MIKHLGRVLPRTGMDPAAAAALLEDLADRALASEFEPVLCLEAPELAEVPPSLRRADGRSIYQRHGGTRYATRAQLAMEQRMLAQARASTAPRLAREQAAHALGADLGATRERAHRRHAAHTRAARADRAARGPGRRRARGPDRRRARLGDQRPGRIRQDPRPGRGRPHLGRGRPGPGHRDHPVPVRPQHPGRRRPACPTTPPSSSATCPAAAGPRPRPDRPRHPARRRRGLDADRPRPSRPDRLRPDPRRQDHPGRGPQPAPGRRKRRRHVPARHPARLRPAGRTRPVPPPLGTARQPAAS